MTTNVSGTLGEVRPPSAMSAEGFNPGAFAEQTNGEPLKPLTEDMFGSVFDEMASYRETTNNVLKWANRPGAVIIVVLALAVLIQGAELGKKPNVEPYVQVVRERCLDVKCKNMQTDVSALTSVANDAKSQDIVARGLLPDIFHQMFSVSKPAQDQYDWQHHVTPYLEPGSPAAQFAAKYLQSNNIGNFAAHGGEVDVTIDPVQPTTEANVYLLSWTIRTIGNDGTAGNPERLFARVEVIWRQATSDNRDGMYVRSVELVDPKEQ